MINQRKSSNKRLSSGIGVWFEQEIENTLQAIDAANLDVAEFVPTQEMRIYRKGYAAAINAVAAALGLNYRSISPLTESILAGLSDTDFDY